MSIILWRLRKSWGAWGHHSPLVKKKTKAQRMKLPFLVSVCSGLKPGSAQSKNPCSLGFLWGGRRTQIWAKGCPCLPGPTLFWVQPGDVASPVHIPFPGLTHSGDPVFAEDCPHHLALARCICNYMTYMPSPPPQLNEGYSRLSPTPLFICLHARQMPRVWWEFGRCLLDEHIDWVQVKFLFIRGSI